MPPPSASSRAELRRGLGASPRGEGRSTDVSTWAASKSERLEAPPRRRPAKTTQAALAVDGGKRPQWPQWPKLARWPSGPKRGRDADSGGQAERRAAQAEATADGGGSRMTGLRPYHEVGEEK